jgi:hypothetical protein
MGYQIPMGWTCYREDDKLHHVRCKICIDVEQGKNYWCQSWMGSISTMAKESASVINLDKLLVNTTLVFTPNMQRNLASITLQGQIIFLISWLGGECSKNSKKKKKKPLVCCYFPPFATRKAFDRLWMYARVILSS